MADERWLVTGASGQLGGHLVARLSDTDVAPTISALTRGGDVGVGGIEPVAIDLRDAASLRAHVAAFQPTHVLHVGAMTAVGEAYANPQEATRINSVATEVLAEAASSVDARFVFTSTDMVFDGASAPYKEDDAVCPLSHYGRTKAEAEGCLARLDRALVVRLPLMYGFPVARRPGTFAGQVAALRSGESLRLFTDEYRTPLWLADAAVALIALARSQETGVIHVAGPERLSRFEMGERFAECLGIGEPRIVAASRLDIDSAEPRPEDLSLDGSRFNALFPDVNPAPIRKAVFDESYQNGPSS